MNRSVAAALSLVALLLLGAGGCGGDDPAPPAATSSVAVSATPVPPREALQRIADGARLIDVRTPEEFDAGHLDGAVNLDVQEGDFEERVSQLPRGASYVVYCASGQRATGAVEQMARLGFTDVVNGGGYVDLAQG